MNKLLIIPRLLISLIVCIIALILPYKIRLVFFKIVSEIVHFPFKLFGFIAKWLLKQLNAGNTYEK